MSSSTQGALVQLHSMGDQDKPLYCNPEKTLFKSRLIPIHPFGKATMTVALNPGASRQVEVEIPRAADLVQKAAVCALFPGLVASPPDDYAYYVNGLMYRYIETATLQIIGVTIAKEWGLSSFIYDTLFKDPDRVANEMSGVRSSQAQLIADAQIAKKPYYLDLDFYCFQFPGSAFPQSAIANKVSVTITFAPIQTLWVSSPSGQVPQAMVDDKNCGSLSDSSISVWLQFDYIMLEADEREKMQSRRLFYLMRQVQRNQFQTAQNQSSFAPINIDLTFNHPAFLLAFVVQAQENIEAKDYINFTYRNEIDPIVSANLVVCNTTYGLEQNAALLRTRNLADVNLNIPRHQIYGIPFCIDCRSQQNTGSLNFTYLDKPQLQVRLRPNSPILIITIFLWVYNYFRVVRGRSGPQFNTQL